MIITIHQPEHMPWLGFFNKIYNADLFVVLDTVQYEKNYFQNRNQIIQKESSTGKAWLTVPVKKGNHADLISEKQIAMSPKDRAKYLNLIENSYIKYPFFTSIYKDIKDILLQYTGLLRDLNVALIKYLLGVLDIKTPLVLASSLGLDEYKPGGSINYDICEYLNASTYLSGPSGRDYLDETPFNNKDIKVDYHDFAHPVYRQPSQPFISHLSVLDLIFSYSPHDSQNIIRKGIQL